MVRNVFVLCTGRCGSVTLSKALSHSDWSVGHETRARNVLSRFDYPGHHIEIDNRLSWFLGELNDHFPDAFYIHLQREPEAVARSFAKRVGIMAGFAEILMGGNGNKLDHARKYVETVNRNIKHFLRDKPHVEFWLEDWAEGFPYLWETLKCRGDFRAAQREFLIKHNGSR